MWGGAEEGAALRAIREAAGLSQTEVARRIGRRQSLVSRWESGDRDPTPFDLVALADCLGVDATNLLVDAGPSASVRRRGSRRLRPTTRAALGRRLRAARTAVGLDAVDTAELCGITPYEVRRLEEGRGAGSAGHYRTVVELFEISLGDLLADLDGSEQALG